VADLEDAFGDVVRKAREGLGLDVADVARLAGVNPERLAALESYQALPNKEESDALARVLKLAREPLWQIARGAYVPVVDPSGPAGGAVGREAMSPDGTGCEVVSFTFQPMGSHGYLIHVRDSGDTFLVDPGGPPDEMLETAAERDWRLTAVLITHGHSDHVAGLERVLEAGPVPVYAHPAECKAQALVPVTGPAQLVIGRSHVRVLFTPGHTVGGLTFVIKGVAAVGDTLFAGSLGRALRGPEYYDRLLASARLILSLPDETLLLPGHGPLTSVGLEKRHNPFVAA